MREMNNWDVLRVAAPDDFQIKLSAMRIINIFFVKANIDSDRFLRQPYLIYLLQKALQK